MSYPLDGLDGRVEFELSINQPHPDRNGTEGKERERDADIDKGKVDRTGFLFFSRKKGAFGWRIMTKIIINIRPDISVSVDPCQTDMWNLSVE